MPARSQLHLAPHVRACHCKGQVILLDLRKGKYLGIGGRGLTALARAVQGWPASAQEAAPFADAPDIETLTTPLITQGLVTDQPPEKTHKPALQAASASLNGEDAVHEASTGPRRVFRFLLSASRASLALRFCSLLTIANRVASRRVRLEQRGAAVSLEALRDAVGAYQKLRPLVLTAHDKCLHDSLALLHFLAGEGLLATWVLGVRTGPFAAHAWVQSGGVVLSDLHEHVRPFQPILTV